MLAMSFLLLTTATMPSIIMSTNPATTSIWLIITCLSLASCLSFITTNWFSLALFLIYLGGMLIMFSYFIIIQPNQHLKIFPLVITTTILIILLLSTIPNLAHINYPTPTPPKMIPFPLLMPSMMNLLLIIMFILFLTLIMVVKITNPSKGPIRPFTNKS